MTIQSKSDLSSLISTNLGDNTAFDITPAELRAVLNNILDSLHGVYGGLYVAGGSTAQTLTTTPEKMTGWTTAFGENGITGDPTTDDDLTVGTAGTYWVEAHFSFTGVANVAYTMQLRKNGSAVAGVLCSHEPGDTAVKHMSFAGLVVCAATDVLTVYGESDEATDQNFTMFDCQLLARRIA